MTGVIEKGQRVAVLGAGPMGLAIAHQLVKDGHHPVVFEADDRVGGQTASFDFNGLTIERYYHFHCTSDDALLELLEELGLSTKMNWVETRMGYWFQNRVQEWGNPIALLKFRGLSLVAKIRYGLHVFISTQRSEWRPLDHVEASGWIKQWVGAEAWEVLWRRLFDYKFYNFAEGLSAAWIWSRIRRVGRSRYSMFREKLGYLEGGTATLLNALKASIENGGGVIRLKSRVSKVVMPNQQVTGIEVDGQFEPFDRVFSTVPLPYVSKMMPDLPPELLNTFSSMKNIAVVCVIAKLKQKLTDNFWLNTNDPEMDIPGLVEYSNLRPLEHHLVYVPFYMPGEHEKFQEPDSAFTDKVRRYLKKINPQLTDDDFIDLRASRYRHAQPICGPGYLDTLPPAALPVKGLWVADTSYYYPEDRGISESVKFGRALARTGLKIGSETPVVPETVVVPQFIRFLFAGGVAAAANFCSRFVFSQWLPYEAAIVCAYLVGMAVAFALMRKTVFPTSTKPLWQQVAKFSAVNLLSVAQTLLVSVAMARWGLPALGVTSHVEAIAHASGVAVPAVSSYFGHKFLTFR